MSDDVAANEGDVDAVEEEPRDPTTLSIGNILSWIVGPVTAIAGLANVVTAEVVVGGLVMIVAGGFVLPPTREMIERELKVKMSRWFVVLAYIALLVVAAAVAAP